MYGFRKYGHFNVKILWTEEPGGLQSMESQRVGHDWVTNTYLPLKKILYDI